MRYYKRSNLELDALVKPLSLKNLTGDKKPPPEGVEGKTKNISASGVMIELTEEIGDNSYVLVHIYLDKDDFPKVIPGQTVWSKSHNDVSQTGIRFLTHREVEEMTSGENTSDDSQQLLGFTEKEQDALDRLLDDILELPEGSDQA